MPLTANVILNDDSSDNIYRPPESVLTRETLDVPMSAELVLLKLLVEQSFLLVFLTSFIGSILGVGVLAVFLVAPGIFFLAYALPGVVTGLVVRFFGRAIDIRYRAFAGIISFLTYWLLIEMLYPNSVWFGFFASVCNASVATYLSRRHLNSEQEAAIYFRRMGINRAPEDRP